MYYWIRTIQLGIKSILLHKLRSMLTMLGIVFGVFSVIAMLAIGEGASDQAQKQVIQLGALNVIVRTVKPLEDSSTSGGGGSLPEYGLTRADYDQFIKTIPTILRHVPIRELQKEVRFFHRSLEARVVGTRSLYQEINRLNVMSGRFLTNTDEVNLSSVCVIADDVAKTLFPLEEPVGKSIQVAGHFFTIVGVTAFREASAAIGGSLSGQEFNKDVYIPISTLGSLYGDLDIQTRSGQFSSEKVELNQVTMEVVNREAVVSTAEIIRNILTRTHPMKRDYSVVVPLELLRQADQLRSIFNVVLGSIAAISLVVGGIGIMNIMLATVTERTREIGIRRALGARQRDIIRQFLTETTVLAGSGGLIGVGLGCAIGTIFEWGKWIAFQWFIDPQMASSGNELFRIFQNMTPSVPMWSLPLAFGISVGVGIVFGLYPAYQAARLDPIEALRHSN